MAASCAVCHDILGAGDKSCAAKCGHVLHNSCWEQWLKRRSECPECRTSTRREDLITLFFNKADSNNVSANDMDTLSSDIQNLNIAATLKRVNGVQPEIIDLDDDDQDSYYSNESEPEVVTLEDSENNESYLGPEEGDVNETSSDSENDDSISADDVSSSDGTGSEDSPSDDSESDESVSDHNGSARSSDDETGSEGSSDEEDSASDSFLSDESGPRSVDGRLEEESDSFKTGSELESDSSLPEPMRLLTVTEGKVLFRTS